MTLSLYRRLRAPLFWIVLLVAYGFAIAPSDEAPSLGGGDKTDHITAFLVLTLLGRAAWWRSPAWRLGVGLSLFGIFIELSQALPIIGRDASIWDWIADSAAILVGLPLAWLIRKWLPPLFEP